MAGELPPFTPPTQTTIDETLKPEVSEAKDVASKIQSEKLPAPIGFHVNHEGVGPWLKREKTKVSIQEVRAHLGGKDIQMTDPSEQDEAINRLVGLNALVPFYE